MKIRKVFENNDNDFLPNILNLRSLVASDIEKVDNSLLNVYPKIIKFIDNIGEDIMFDGAYIAYADYYIIGVSNTGQIIVKYKKTRFIDDTAKLPINFIKDSTVISLLTLRINQNLYKTYKFQKDIIENHPDKFHIIQKDLHEKIKKEYPHLLSGKDLNLL